MSRIIPLFLVIFCISISLNARKSRTTKATGNSAQSHALIVEKNNRLKRVGEILKSKLSIKSIKSTFFTKPVRQKIGIAVIFMIAGTLTALIATWFAGVWIPGAIGGALFVAGLILLMMTIFNDI